MEVAVIGLGIFGSSVATTLTKKGVSVTVFDINENRVQSILDSVDDGFVLDSTDERALAEASIDHYDKVIIALGKNALNASLLTVLNLKELGVENIIAKASSKAQYKLLDKIGVSMIVQPEKDMGEKLAIKISSLCVLDKVEISPEIFIENILVNTVFKKQTGQTIQEINLRKYFKVNIITIERAGEIIVPESDTTIQKGDTLMIVGKKSDLEKFEKHFKIK